MIDRIHAFRAALQDAATEQRIPSRHGDGLFAPSVREVIIAADRDTTGITAAQCARQRFIREGRRVSVVLPPVGSGDFNEVIL